VPEHSGQRTRRNVIVFNAIRLLGGLAFTLGSFLAFARRAATFARGREARQATAVRLVNA
jgi:hypothetical protein